MVARVGDLCLPVIARGRGRPLVGFVVHGQREQPLDDPTHRRVSPRPARHRARAPGALTDFSRELGDGLGMLWFASESEANETLA
jgi:hypothetical protein